MVLMTTGAILKFRKNLDVEDLTNTYCKEFQLKRDYWDVYVDMEKAIISIFDKSGYDPQDHMESWIVDNTL